MMSPMSFILRGKDRLTLLSSVAIMLVMIIASSEARFTCNSPARTNCSALIDYFSTNSTTLSEIQTLFGVKHLRDILGANGLPQNTLKTQIVNAAQKIRIPFTCSCSNGIGVSNGRPVYSVVAGDEGLDQIARMKFAGLVTYQEIAAASNISNPNVIDIGQNLTIPLPCSCDDVDGKRVVHYGLLVESGSSVEGIAQKYGVSSDTLLKLNNLSSPNDLKADAVLDVPLPACSSNIGIKSIDYPLLVSNATYVFTANNCVKCSCNAAANNWTLNCEPWSSSDTNQTCSSRQCSDGSFIGNSTTSNCNRQSCVYSGYNSTAIFTSVLSDRTCPGSGGYSLKMTGFQDWFWKVLVLLVFICHLVQ